MAKVQAGSGRYARGADVAGRAGAADVVRQVLTVIGAVGQVVAGSFGFLFGLNVGQISDEYGTLITPAGYAFAIWGPIFLLLLAYAVYQALPAQRTSPLLRRVGLPIALACLGDTVWEILFPIRQFVPAQIVIVGILASLLVAVWRLAAYRRADPLTRAERWLVALPLGLFCGWLTAATLAGLAITLRTLGALPGGRGELLAVVPILLLCGGIASGVLLLIRGLPLVAAIPYAGAVVWAIGAIAAAQRGGSTPIVALALVLIVVLLIALIGGALGRRGEQDAAHPANLSRPI
jgi:hypothetical protein